MTQLVKTTVILPEELLHTAKLTAVQEKTTLSRIISEALEERVHKKPGKKVSDPMKLLGKFSLGATEIYKKRSDLYDDYLRRKMGI